MNLEIAVKKILTLLTALLLVPLATVTPLFDGKTFTGWEGSTTT
jgi:hypothetical protein